MMKDAENVRVVVRVRPLTEREECSGDSELVSCQGDRSVQVIEQQGRGRPVTGTAFQFNQCFGVECGQEQLFERCGVLSLLDHDQPGSDIPRSEIDQFMLSVPCGIVARMV